MPAVPKPSDMFADARTGAEVAERFEAYKASLHQVQTKYGRGGYVLTPENGLVKTGHVEAAAIETLTKALTADQMSSLSTELDLVRGLTADMAKDWSIPAAANNVNMVPYDLQAPARMLVPRNTPLRNRIPREQGQGLACQFRRVLGWTNTSTGGVADQLPFFDSQANTTNFGSLALRRPPKISYASDQKTVNYVELGVSDQVNWKTRYASLGFEDVLSLSQTMKLWAHLLGEEKSMLYSRGATANGYIGAVTAPTVTVATSGTGGAVAAGTYYIKVTARGGPGESVPSAEINTGALSGGASQFTITVSNQPAGAIGYNVYISTTTNTETYVTSFSGNTLTILTTPATGGAAVPSVDSSAGTGYDGLLTVLTDPAQSGYIGRILGGAKVYNATTPASSLGDGPWQDAFAALWGSGQTTKLQADPDEVWVDGATRRSLGDWVKLSASTSAYRISLTQETTADGVTIGSVASSIANQTTGTVVPLNAHPFMPAGCSIVRSSTLPIPDSEVSATSAVRNVQDVMSMDWPQIQMTIDSSTYQFGTFVHYAPMFSGAIVGLN